MEQVSTGIFALDQVLDGGLPERSAILVCGRPGSGKTILAHQIICHNASTERKVVYFTTLAEPVVKVIKFQQQFTFFKQDQIQQSVIYQDLGSNLRNGDAACCLAGITEVLRQHKPSLIVIDTLKTISEIITLPIKYREFILDLTLRAAAWGCTTVLLGNMPRMIWTLVLKALLPTVLYICQEQKKRDSKNGFCVF